MTDNPQTPPRSLSPTNTTHAILWMLGAVFCFSALDANAKLLSQSVGPVPTVWARYAGQTLVVFLLVLPRLRRVLRSNYPRLQLARSVFLMCATTSFFIGISNMNLTAATAIIDINPLFITIGAALFLGEKFGRRRAAAIVVAALGALLVIRPGAAVFSPYSLFPLAAALFYSAYALTTRFVGRGEDVWTSLFYTALFGAVVLSAVVPFYWQPIGLREAALMGIVTVFGTASQLCVIRALMAGEASMLAPFGYIGLVFATLWSAALFGEFPDNWTIAGALVIAGAGIYVWHRETFAKQP